MTIEVTLPVGATAEPDTCGSCKFYRSVSSDFGSSYVNDGRCEIKLPPINYVNAGWDGEGFGPRHVMDTDRCYLWKTSGKIFIVSRVVGKQ